MEKPEDGNFHPKNGLNGLPGNRWLYFTRSVVRTDVSKSTGFKLREVHGSNKSPELMREFIEFFTKEGGYVLDPFSGVGGTLLGASMCNRKALGIELNEKWVSVYKEVCKEVKLHEQPVVIGDCLEIMKKLGENKQEKFDLILTDPPYGPYADKTMCNGKYPNCNRKSRYSEFSSSEKDLGNTKTFEEYFKKMGEFFASAEQILKNDLYLVVFTKNCYRNGEYIMINAELSKLGKASNFILKGEIIWEPKGTRLRPYGYPFVFVPNIIHHNILVFRKEEKK